MDRRPRGVDDGHIMPMPQLNDPSLLLSIAASFAAAGLVKGVSGMGLPTLAMALLSLFMPAPEAAALMLAPALLSNVAQCLGPQAPMLTRRLWPLWVGMAAGTWLSPWSGLRPGAGETARLLLGPVLLAYGLFGLWRPQLPAPGRHAAWIGAAAGLLGGALNAATGVFVLPMVPYLQALKLEREAMIQALGLSFTVAALALAARLGPQPGMSWPAPLAIALALLAAFAGMGLGARLRGRLAPQAFQRSLYGVFLLLGLLMLAR